jgi:hypothetical protein
MLPPDYRRAMALLDLPDVANRIPGGGRRPALGA